MSDRRRSPLLPLLGVPFGLWAIVAPYVGLFGKLTVRSSVELVDHALPGAVVTAVAVVAYAQLRNGRPSPTLLLVGGLVITLAGLWMLSTHVGLISQARQGIVPGGAVAWHGLPGIALTLLGVAWTARFWAVEEAVEQSSAGR